MSIFDGIGGIRQGLDYHLARQNVLVSNLSHLDTPGYKPLELERTRAGFHGALAQEVQAAAGGLKVTDAAHIGPRQDGSVNAGHIVKDPTAQPGADGNGVNVDREASKIAANQVRYDVLTRLVAQSLSGLAWAANDGRNG